MFKRAASKSARPPLVLPPLGLPPTRILPLPLVVPPTPILPLPLVLTPLVKRESRGRSRSDGRLGELEAIKVRGAAGGARSDQEQRDRGALGASESRRTVGGQEAIEGRGVA